MKYYLRALLLSLLVGVLFLLTGCGETALSTPSALTVDGVELTLSWREVKNAAYYTVEITSGDTTETKDTGKASYSLERLAEGTYSLRVKAVIAGGDEEHKDSAWSEKVSFTREHETGLIFNLTAGGTAFAVSGIGSAEGDITIPDTYRGLPVTAIADRAFYNKNAVTSVTLGKHVSTIGKQAFANCSYLTSVTLSDTLTAIGEQAFQSCRALASALSLPSGVRTVGDQAFEYCRLLPSVSLPTGLLSLGEGTFGGCEALTEITLPDGMTGMGESVFARCTALASVRVGGGITEIPKDAFRGCTALTSLSLGTAVRQIGESAFLGCTSLAALSAPESLVRINDYAFSGCSALAAVSGLGTSLTGIGKDAFAETALYLNDVADAVYVGDWFLGCKSGDMKKNEVANGTVGIADYALAGCESFADSSIILPDTVKYIGEGAFSSCKKLSVAVLGGGVLTVGEHAFSDATALVRVVLGAYDKDSSSGLGKSSLAEIGAYAFDGCTSLESVDIPASVSQIGIYAFRSTGFYNAADRDVYAGNWYVACKSDGAFGAVSVKDGTVGIADYAFYRCKSVTAVKLPDSVERLGRSVFYQCTSLGSVTLPATLTEIPDYTFYHCDDLLLPKLPETLTRIGRSAFYKCRLTEDGAEGDAARLVIPASVTEIGDYAFYGCTFTYTDRSTAAQLDGGIRTLVIGDGVRSIGAQAFSGIVTLTDVTFGQNVRTVGDKAFYKCTALVSVRFNEGLLSLGSRAFSRCESLVSIQLPASLATVGDYAFYRCGKVRELTLGGAASIGASAFLGLALVEELTLPDTLTEIGRQAFRGMSSLKTLILPATLSRVDAHAFYGCASLTLYMTASETPEGFDARWNSSYRPVVYATELDEGGYVASFLTALGGVENLSTATPLSPPVRSGCTFVGFATEAGAVPVYTVETLSEAPSGIRLYAVYTVEN